MKHKEPRQSQDLRDQRIQIEREIAELVAEQQGWYLNYVVPAAAEAKIATSGGRKGGEVKVLDLKTADMLDESTPTGRFEKGRAHVAVLSSRIASLRTQEKKIASQLNSSRRRSPQIDWVDRLSGYAQRRLGKS